MKKSITPLLFWLLSIGLLGNASAITFGEPTSNAEYPHVGTLLFVQNGAGFYSCSGTLLSPTVMLTAAHCVSEYGNTNNLTYVRFEEDALADIGDYNSLQDWFDAKWILASQVIPHPQYSDYSEFPDTYDVGLVILSEPVYVSRYGTLPSESMLEEILGERGNATNRWTAVGFGSHGVIKPFSMNDDYARYKSTTRLIEIKSTFTGSDTSAKFTNNPGKKGGGTCFGDSGGPVFYRDTSIVGAVVSWGHTPCIGVDYQFRIDTPAALDFITPYVLP